MRDVLDIHARHGATAATLYVAVHQRGRMPAGRADLAILLDIAPSMADALVSELTAAGLVEVENGHDGHWLRMSSQEVQA
jgi:DNA-binding IscR family transcriptional regulator